MLFHIYLPNKILGIHATSLQELRVKACTEFWQNKRAHNYREVFYWLDERKKHMLIENAVDFLHCLEENKKKDFIKIHFAFIATESGSESPSSMTYAAIHINSTCKYCEIEPIVGERYLCGGAPSYNLCEICEDFEVHSKHQLVDESVGPNEDLRNSLLMLEKPPSTTLDEFIRSTLQNVNKKIDRQNQLVVVMSQILTNNVNIMAKMSEAFSASKTEENEALTNHSRATESSKYRCTEPTSCIESDSKLSEDLITMDEKGIQRTTSIESSIDNDINSDGANGIPKSNSTIAEPNVEDLLELISLPPNSNMDYCPTIFDRVESVVSEPKCALEPGPAISKVNKESYSKLTPAQACFDIGVEAEELDAEIESFSHILSAQSNYAPTMIETKIASVWDRNPSYMNSKARRASVWDRNPSYMNCKATKLKSEEGCDAMLKYAESNSTTSFEDKPLAAINGEAASPFESRVKSEQLDIFNESSFQIAYDNDVPYEKLPQSSANERRNEEAYIFSKHDKASQTFLDFEIINMQDINSAMSAKQLVSAQQKKAMGIQPDAALVETPPTTKLIDIDCYSREGSNSSIELIDDEP